MHCSCDLRRAEWDFSREYGADHALAGRSAACPSGSSLAIGGRDTQQNGERVESNSALSDRNAVTVVVYAYDISRTIVKILEQCGNKQPDSPERSAAGSQSEGLQ